ncbi:ABC transporter ATP-binding protein [Streptomyces hirsutus]
MSTRSRRSCSGVADALYYVIRLGVFLGLLFYLQWDLTLLALVIVPLFWGAARRFSRLIKEASRERRRRSGSISAIAEESLGNVALVQAYNRQRWEERRFERENVGRFRATMASTRIRAVYGSVVEVIEVSGVLAVMGLGTWKLAQEQLTLGGLLVFLALIGSLYSPVRGLSHLGTTFYAASASAERIIELLDQRPQVVEAAGARRIGRARGDMEFDGVSFRYPGTPSWALSDVSFHVAAGETLALVGASGAGKSTVAKLHWRFPHRPRPGAVRLDGTDLRDLRLSDLRESVAVVLQETLVFHGTVRDNIAYGRPEATQADIVAAARAADAHEFIELLPEGYDTMVGQRGRTLSGGQRQRLAIARAMIRDAPVLLLDEPTTGLDVRSGRRIMDPLRRLMAGRTTVVISHNLLTVRDATRIVVLDQGRIVECGAHDDLLERGGTYARLHRLNALVGAAPAGSSAPGTVLP